MNEETTQPQHNIKRTLASVLLVAGVFVVGAIIFHTSPGAPDTASPDRDGIMHFFSDNIGELAPERPVLGGTWRVIQFRFVDNRGVYVEYEDGHIARAFLVLFNAERGGEFSYEVVGIFNVTPDELELVSGVDPLAGEPYEIFQFNEDEQTWRRVVN